MEQGVRAHGRVEINWAMCLPIPGMESQPSQKISPRNRVELFAVLGAPFVKGRAGGLESGDLLSAYTGDRARVLGQYIVAMGNNGSNGVRIALRLENAKCGRGRDPSYARQP